MIAIRLARLYPLGLTVSAAVAGLLVLSGCGSPNSSSEARAAITLSCDGDHAEIIDLLRSGLPTYDYNPASDLAALVERSDVVVTGTVASVVRVAEPDSSDPDSPGNDSWTAITSADAEILAQSDATISGAVSTFSTGSKWAVRGKTDPLSDPVTVTGLAFVAFLHQSPFAPGGFRVDVEGFLVSCVGSTRAPDRIIAPIPDDARGFSIEELVGAISSEQNTSDDIVAGESQCVDPDQDIAGEPDWRRYGEYRDWTREGCLIRIDVLADRMGPAHCDFESVRVIITGSPLGQPYTSPQDTVHYIRDPDNVMGLADKLEPTDKLPPAAIDSGYRSNTEEVWLDPDDSTAIYLVTTDRTERIPAGEQLLCD